VAGTRSQQVPIVTPFTKAALAGLAGLERVYREGLAYSKAEVILLGLYQRNECTGDLVVPVQPTRLAG
jgi:DNA polymerase V